MKERSGTRRKEAGQLLWTSFSAVGLSEVDKTVRWIDGWRVLDSVQHSNGKFGVMQNFQH